MLLNIVFNMKGPECVCLSLSLSLSLSVYVCGRRMQLSPGMGSKTLSFFGPVSGGPPEWCSLASRRQLGGGDT
jgi:hypothetical protein